MGRRALANLKDLPGFLGTHGDGCGMRAEEHGINSIELVNIGWLRPSTCYPGFLVRVQDMDSVEEGHETSLTSRSRQINGGAWCWTLLMLST